MILIGTNPSAATSDTDDTLTLADPETLSDRPEVDVRTATRSHESRYHCGIDVDGRAVVGVRNDDGEHLLLLHDGMGIALLPHADVESGDDWATSARQAVEETTGVSVTLDGVDALRIVDHRLDDEQSPHATTRRVLFRASPAGGEVHDCKRDADAGSDGWRAAWVADLPDGFAPPPEGGPRHDLQWFLG